MSVKFKIKPMKEAKMTLCDWTTQCITNKDDCNKCPVCDEHARPLLYTHRAAMEKLREINREMKG